MNNSLNDKFEEAKKLINKSENIFIASHINPDGDNVGSILSMGLALKKIDKNVNILKSDVIPKDFKFLPGIDLIQDFKDNISSKDLFIVLDSSDENRLGELKRILTMTPNVINIDHHVSNTNFGKINIVDSSACATGELVYKLLDHMNIKIDRDMGTNIYTALSTDSGSFKYESVTGDTHRIAANLLDIGIDHNNINLNLYEKMSINRFRLINDVLSKLKTYNNGKIAVVKVNNAILDSTDTTMEDTDSIVSYIRKIDTVEVACLLKEFEPEEIKVSLRSKECVDVSKVCEKFSGGGHKRAAGCKIEKNIDEAEKLLIKEIRNYLGD